jgi:hypothetical protein
MAVVAARDVNIVFVPGVPNDLGFARWDAEVAEVAGHLVTVICATVLQALTDARRALLESA